MRPWLPLFLLLALPATAIAGMPSPPGPYNCSRIPSRIVLVGTNGSVPDASVGQFEITVCRFNYPYAAVVEVRLPTNPLGVRLGREVEPAQELASCIVSAVNNEVDGTCAMTLAGSVDLAQQQPGVAPAVSVYANGVLFGEVPVVCYDLDGANGVGANDLTLWLTMFGSGEPWLVADYNGDSAVGADDLAMWLTVFGSGSQVESATPVCP